MTTDQIIGELDRLIFQPDRTPEDEARLQELWRRHLIGGFLYGLRLATQAAERGQRLRVVFEEDDQ